MNLNFSTKEKCLIRDLINIEIKNCSNDFNLNSYVEKLKKLKFKIQLDAQQLKKAIKLYGNDIEEINFKPVIKIKDIYKPERILEQELKEIRKDK